MVGVVVVVAVIIVFLTNMRKMSRILRCRRRSIPSILRTQSAKRASGIFPCFAAFITHSNSCVRVCVCNKETTVTITITATAKITTVMTALVGLR